MKLKGMTATSRSSTVEVSNDIFGQQENPALLAQAVRVYLSNLRQGTSKVKTRSAVKRSKSKWYRQKGTGNARHGSRNAPIFVGGGVAHGPTGKENWNRSLSKNMKSKALKVALSMQADNIVVTDNFNSLKGKTAEAAALFNKMFDDMTKTLVVLGEDAGLIRRSLQNIPQVMTVNAQELNTLQIVTAERIIFSKNALDLLETRLSAKKAAKPVAKPATKEAKKTVTKKKATPKKKPVAKKKAAPKKKATKKATK